MCPNFHVFDTLPIFKIKSNVNGDGTHLANKLKLTMKQFDNNK